jgi:hypothetical protein
MRHKIRLNLSTKGVVNMFLFMGAVHLVAAGVLALAGSDQAIIWSQFIGGALEFSIGLAVFLKSEELI